MSQICGRLTEDTPACIGAKGGETKINKLDETTESM